MLNPYATKLKKRKRKSSGKKPNRIPDEVLSRLEMRKAVNYQMLWIIPSTDAGIGPSNNNAEKVIWGLAALCDWENIYRTITTAETRNTAIAVPDVTPNMGIMVNDSIHMAKNSITIKVSNTQASYVLVKVHVWVAKRDFGSIGADSAGTATHFHAWRNLFDALATTDQDFNITGETNQAVAPPLAWNSDTEPNGYLPAIDGGVGVPPQLKYDGTQEPNSMRYLKNYLEKESTTDYVCGPGQSFSQEVKTKSFKVTPGLHFVNIAGTMLAPGASGGPPMAFGGLTKFISVTAKTIQLHRSSTAPTAVTTANIDATRPGADNVASVTAGAEPYVIRESYTEGSYRLHADVIYTNELKALRHFRKAKNFIDWRPTIALHASEIAVGSADVSVSFDAHA